MSFCRRLAVLAAIAIGPVGAWAQTAPELPLWELGAGAVVSGGADYPGSSEYSGGGAVFPYLTYRGRLLELGGDATARLVPFRGDRFEIGLTFDGSSAVDSRDNALRGTLGDLDALAEIGPEFIYKFAEAPAFIGDGTGRFEASLQTRAVFSIDDEIDHVGSLMRPVLRYRQNGALKPGSRISASIGPVFATRGLHDFFYSVPASGALPEYAARSGYMGTEIDVSVRYPLMERARLIAGVGVTILSGSANHSSPLLADEFNASAFVGVTYSFFQSKRRTTRDR